MIIENDRLILRKLNKRDLPTLKILRDSPIVYRYEPTYLAERQDTPEKALMLLQQLDLDRDRQCILGVYQKTRPDLLVGLAELYDYKPSGKIISTFADGRGSRSLCVKRVGAAPPHWACAGNCEAHLRVAPQSGGQVPPEQASQPAAAPWGGGEPASTLSVAAAAPTPAAPPSALPAC